ncbi:MAG: hypothetical protein AAGF88_03260 [Pseudomonadota bacterium]
MTRILCALILIILPLRVLSDVPQVVGASYVSGRLSVTISHPDTGWDHYADAWEVLDTNGNSLGIRELAHPHVDEQPFTRSLSVTLPGDGPWDVLIRARDSVHGWSEPIPMTLP